MTCCTHRVLFVKEIAAFRYAVLRHSLAPADHRVARLTECDLVRLFDKDISSVHTPAGDEPARLSVEESLRNSRGYAGERQWVTLQRHLSMGQREFKQRPEAVFTFLLLHKVE